MAKKEPEHMQECIRLSLNSDGEPVWGLNYTVWLQACQRAAGCASATHRGCWHTQKIRLSIS